MECGELRLGTCARIHGVACPEQQTHYDAIGVADAKDEKKFYGTSACREQLCTGRCCRGTSCSFRHFKDPARVRAMLTPNQMQQLMFPQPAPKTSRPRFRRSRASTFGPASSGPRRAFDFAGHFAIPVKPTAS
jgi:hypothetical protein